ncbi:MAG: PD-(D/E)XK nuclease family protein [Flexilinea sp.]
MKQISQSQIHDYLTCPWHFYLSNIVKLTWPEPVSARYQELVSFSRLGKSFHQYVHRFIQGVSYEELTSQVYEPEIDPWLDNFNHWNPLPSGGKLYSEIELSAIFNEILWIGYVDAIAVQPGKVLIFDWKTSKKLGDPSFLQKAPQTRLYRFLLMHNEKGFVPDLNETITPEMIEMVYWYPNFPAVPIRLVYSSELFRQDEFYFRDIAEKLSLEEPEFFPQTTDEETCMTCRFQTRCHRGLQNSSQLLEEKNWDEQESFDFDKESDGNPPDSPESSLGVVI